MLECVSNLSSSSCEQDILKSIRHVYILNAAATVSAKSNYPKTCVGESDVTYDV